MGQNIAKSVGNTYMYGTLGLVVGIPMMYFIFSSAHSMRHVSFRDVVHDALDMGKFMIQLTISAIPAALLAYCIYAADKDGNFFTGENYIMTVPLAGVPIIGFATYWLLFGK
jgi:hypothetical protein